jgi:hypothetical protein
MEGGSMDVDVAADTVDGNNKDADNDNELEHEREQERRALYIK